MNGPEQKTPWESWELGADIPSIESLEKADVSKSKEILVKVLATIEGCEGVFEFIPDIGPAPVGTIARVFVGLASLAKTCVVARDTIREFIKELATWIDSMLSAFRRGESGPAVNDTWHDFKPIADFLEEIFGWADRRLNDQGLHRLRHWSIPSQIDDFRQKLQRAQDFFQMTREVSNSKAHDRQERILTTIQRSQEEDTRIRFLKDMLQPRIQVTITKEPCLLGTREGILSEIGDWLSDTSSASPRLFWLTGMPGCGKSAICMSVAEESDKEGVLWAQYFFDRSDPRTTDATKVFRSMAWQLASNSTRSKKIVLKMVETLASDTGRSIAKYFDHDHVQHLFVEPLKEAANRNLSQPVVIVFDALDEGEHEIKKFCQLLANSIPSLPSNVKIFVTSRNAVRDSFPSLPPTDAKSRYLDTDEPSSLIDVEFFIRESLRGIARDFEGRLEDDWIGEADIDEICAQASGLFVWARSAIAFIKDRLERYGNRPKMIKEMLTILKTKPLEATPLAEEGFKPIGTLYMEILRDIYPQESPDVDEFRRIVGAMIFVAEPVCLRSLKYLLYPDSEDIEDTGDSRATHVLRASSMDDVPDFQNLFLLLRWIFKPNTARITLETIPRCHKSFVGFIRDPSQSGYFCVNSTEVHEDIARQCLRLLRTFPGNISIIYDTWDASNFISSPFQYACFYWEYHLRFTSPDGRNTEAFDRFVRRSLRNWVGVFSVLGSPQDTLSILESASSWNLGRRQMNAEILELVSHIHNFLSTVVRWDSERSHWAENIFNFKIQFDLLPEVSVWLRDQTAPRLLWITGPAGVGKTTFAMAIARLATNDHILGASLFTGGSAPPTTSVMLRDIAVQLCGTFPHFILELFNMVETTDSPESIWTFSNIQELIIKSGRRVDDDVVHKPLLIIIDALDEYRDNLAVPSLLQLFTRCFDGVPSLKLLVTSRFMPHADGTFSDQEFEALGRVMKL